MTDSVPLNSPVLVVCLAWFLHIIQITLLLVIQGDYLTEHSVEGGVLTKS